MNLLKDPKGRLICIIAVLVLAIISSFIIKTVRQSYFDTFVSCEGVVTEIEWFKNYPEKYARIYKSKNLGSSWKFRTYYSFTVDEKNYGSSFLSSKHVSKYRVGDPIEVWYNPKNPNDSCGYVPSPEMEPFVPYFLAAPVIVFIATARSRARGRALYDE
ncbi:MAG: DUF3592 domain-containing protein [Clostridia bacterium]|nr:DUF3592 domain-containing protein [Clostridia bacterium]